MPHAAPAERWLTPPDESASLPEPALTVRRLAWSVLALLALAALAGLGYRIHLGTLAHLNRTLSRGLGVPVLIRGVNARWGPQVLLEGVQIGPWITARELRLGLTVESRWPPRVGIRAATLVGPVLQWDGEPALLERLLGAPPERRPRAHPAPAAASSRRKPLELHVADGALALKLRWRGRSIELQAERIWSEPRGALQTLVLGHTRLLENGIPLADLPAAAAELDALLGYRPQRLALAGATLQPPGGGTPWTVPSAKLVRSGGAVRLDGTLAPARSRGGRVRVSGTLGPDLSLSGDHSLQLTFRALDLGALRSTFPGRLTGLALEGRLEGQVHVGAMEARGVPVRPSLRFDRARVRHPWIADGTVGPLDGRIEGVAWVKGAPLVARLEDLVLRLPPLELRARGTLNPAQASRRLDLALHLAPLPCQALLDRAVASGFAPRLAGMALTGQVGGAARLRLAATGVLGDDVEAEVTPASCRVTRDAPRADPAQLRHAVRMPLRLAGRPTGSTWTIGPDNPAYVPLARISRHLRAAFVVAEDGRFFRHEGFDGEALRKALLVDLRHGRWIKGASTISQQLVKNLLLDHRRTFARKFQEMVLTWRMEQVLSKQRILELYLNMVELGPGVLGVEQASQRYFGRSAAAVTPLQAAHLAAMTPSPVPLARRFAQERPGKPWMERLGQLLAMMQRAGNLSRAERARWATARLDLIP
ncbi:MAG: transglycosylase domain-containing protein [Deltaproteobacteria bacterium]|nr:transglycosylase domain-containing protein [Deltaproteobacteria bacterium]